VSAAWDPARLTELRALRGRAARSGVHGVPSLTVDDEPVFFGAPPPGRVAAALDGWQGDPADLRRRLHPPR
jgi:hypothetical protein